MVAVILFNQVLACLLVYVLAKENKELGEKLVSFEAIISEAAKPVVDKEQKSDDT